MQRVLVDSGKALVIVFTIADSSSVPITNLERFVSTNFI